MGQGQFGRVFCGCHRKTGKIVALKDLDQYRFPTNKFLRELRFLLSLQHPNIVTCHALEHTPTGRYLVMDYCEGGTLRTLMEYESTLNLAQCLKLVADVLAGLDCAHNHCIVHRDIKPDNILLNLRPDGWIARISDFGIARLSQELMESSDNTGSPAYMAPEQFYGQYSIRSDIYAAGVLLFELLTGDRPFSGPPNELMSAHLNQPVKIPSRVPEPLQSILLTALQKLPARRFHSARQMLEAIQQVQAKLRAQASAPNSLVLDPPSPMTVRSLEERHLESTLAVAAPVTDLAVVSSDVFREAGCDLTLPTVQSSLPAPSLYWAAGSTVECQIYLDGVFGSKNYRRAAIRLSESVNKLIGCPQGCLAIAERSIYWLNGDRTSPAIAVEPIAQFDADFVADLEPRGRWIAIATSDGKLAIVDWRYCLTSKVSEGERHIPTLTREVRAGFQNPPLLLALSSRHVAAIAPGETSTLLEIFTRRGTRAGSYQLPAVLGKAIASQTPYRLLATEPSNRVLLLIDLKPYRIRRLPIANSLPQLLIATAWGYILANTQGEIVLLDREGEVTSVLDAAVGATATGNAFHLGAIAAFNTSGLAIATTNDKQGYISTVDLRQLDVDIVF